jgi:hypothetical protein
VSMFVFQFSYFSVLVWTRFLLSATCFSVKCNVHVAAYSNESIG